MIVRSQLRLVPLAAALLLVSPVLGDGTRDGSGPLALHAQSQSSVVYVVRHAEREEDGSDDPPISEVGRSRAELLATIFGDAGLTHLHTTDLMRTRSTLQPTADTTGLDPSTYDPSDMAAFADRLSSTPGRHLVVGHSNTNPELVDALGGDPGAPIEEMEYDRGYVVVVVSGGFTGSSIFRFGQPFEAEAPDTGGGGESFHAGTPSGAPAHATASSGR